MGIILYLQNLGNWLVPIAEFFTFLGFEEFYLLIMPAIYWCVDSLIGARLAFMLVATTSLNGVLKLAFHSPRPYWVSAEIKALSSETSFGIPSGHAQNAFALWGTWAGSLRKTWAWLMAGFVILMIGLSRLALGMHFPSDVLLCGSLAAYCCGYFSLWKNLSSTGSILSQSVTRFFQSS